MVLTKEEKNVILLAEQLTKLAFMGDRLQEIKEKNEELFTTTLKRMGYWHTDELHMVYAYRCLCCGLVAKTSISEDQKTCLICLSPVEQIEILKRSEEAGH